MCRNLCLPLKLNVSVTFAHTFELQSQFKTIYDDMNLRIYQNHFIQWDVLFLTGCG